MPKTRNPNFIVDVNAPAPEVKELEDFDIHLGENELVQAQQLELEQEQFDNQEQQEEEEEGEEEEEQEEEGQEEEYYDGVSKKMIKTIKKLSLSFHLWYWKHFKSKRVLKELTE